MEFGISAYRDKDGSRIPFVTASDGTRQAVGSKHAWSEALALLSEPGATSPAKHSQSTSGAPLCAPMPEGGMIYAIGANYADHMIAGMAVMRELGFTNPAVAPPRPGFFNKPVGPCLADPGATIAPPPGCTQFDAEIELCVIIGRAGRDIADTDALSHIAGYTIALDMSARDFQMLPGTLFGVDLFAGKVFDGSCPLGPVIVPSRLIDDPQALALGTRVNGETWQNSSTADMTIPVSGIISALSRLVTLRPGDAILTGTPAGTGFETGKSLKPGDVVTGWIDGIGELSVTVA